MEHRPIRYRVWDGERMHAPPSGVPFDKWGGASFVLLPDGQVYEAEWDYETGWHLAPRPGCIALLSTGRTDAEGTEVFDGAVLRHERLGILTVCWVDALGPGWGLVGDGSDPSCPSEWFLTDWVGESRVIGHIFESTFAHLRAEEPA